MLPHIPAHISNTSAICIIKITIHVLWNVKQAGQLEFYTCIEHIHIIHKKSLRVRKKGTIKDLLDEMA